MGVTGGRHPCKDYIGSISETPWVILKTTAPFGYGLYDGTKYFGVQNWTLILGTTHLSLLAHSRNSGLRLWASTASQDCQLAMPGVVAMVFLHFLGPSFLPDSTKMVFMDFVVSFFHHSLLS